jgi:glycosyltransferase involved in cell wall biosynthesis
VAFVYHHRTNGRGGEGVHIMGMVRALEEAGETVTIVGPPGVDPRQTAGATPVDKGSRQVRGIQRVWRWVSAHAPQSMFALLEVGYNAHAQRVVSRALRDRPGANLYERYAFALLAGVVAGRRQRRVVLLEVNEVVGIKRAREQVMVPLMRALERRIFRRADALLCVSSFLAVEAERRGARPGRVHVVPNAVDTKLFDALGTGVAIRRELGIPDDAVVAGFVGWFDHWDRLDVMVDAVARVRDAHPHVRLILVGDGPTAGDLRRQIEQNGLSAHVIMTGPVPRNRIPAYIDAMDIGLLADSNAFGSPIVLFELMGMGKAVIAPDVAPVRDVIDDGDNGWIIPPGDTQAIAAALGRLLAKPDERHAMGERARRRVLERHTWAANARRVMDIAASLEQGQTP